MAKAQVQIPSRIGDTRVRRGSEPVMRVKGERWLTLVPLEAEDSRLWEYSLDTGRILQTRPGGGT